VIVQRGARMPVQRRRELAQLMDNMSTRLLAYQREIESYPGDLKGERLAGEIEKARTVLDGLGPDLRRPATRAEINDHLEAVEQRKKAQAAAEAKRKQDFVARLTGGPR
jgi:hypothetical protein